MSLDFLNDRLDYERIGMPKASSALGLGRTRRLLKRLGDPHETLTILHVAGTKGKGSTSTMLAAALEGCGKRVGLYCSPHLHQIEERFQINGQMIESANLEQLVEQVRPAVESLDREVEQGPTFFEITTAMGLLHFAQNEVDVVVLEVGMGGRLDSTNIVRPLVSAITSISLDHTKILGETPGAIAREKAGIIKRGRPTVSGATSDDAREAIRQVANQRQSLLREIDQDFHYVYEPPPMPLTKPTAGSAKIRTWRTDWGLVTLPMLGPHQGHNLAVTLATLDAAAEQGLDWDREQVLTGIARASLPARVEVFESDSRRWVIDGAHNAASGQALVETLRHCFPPGPRTLVFGVSRDKDRLSLLRELLPAFDVIVATRFLNNPRAVPPEQVAESMQSLLKTPDAIAPDPPTALEIARQLTPPQGLIVVTGSLFLAGEARAWILSGQNSET